MYNEYEHLKMLGKKYDLGDFTIGVFRGAFMYSRRSPISFENFLKEYTEINSREWKLCVIEQEIERNKKIIKKSL